jgi:hypothetical protein
LVEYSLHEGSGAAANSSSGPSFQAVFYATNGAVASNLWSAPGGGVSTISSDFSFETTSASGMGTTHRGPHLRVPMGTLAPVSNLTITGWFRPSTGDLNRAVLITWRKPGTNVSLVGLAGGPPAARSRLRLSASPLFLGSLDAASAFEPSFSTAGQWAFFAVAFDGASSPRSVTFMRGSTGSTSAVSSVATFPNLPSLDLSDTTMFIGSNDSFSDPFQGHMDNIALFSNALTLEEIEKVRLRALAPERLRLGTSGQLKWSTLSGRIYHLERSADLQQWDGIPPAIVGDGQDKVYEVQLQSDTKGFYRLRFE